jgi:hypothetical protein
MLFLLIGKCGTIFEAFRENETINIPNINGNILGFVSSSSQVLILCFVDDDVFPNGRGVTGI